MKKLLFLLSAVLLTLAPQLRAQTTYTKITFGWTNTDQSVPTCGTVTNSCLKNITITDTTASTVVSSTIVPTATSFIYTPAAGSLSFGYSHTFSITLTAIGADGTLSTTPAVLTTVTVNALLPPSGFGGVLTP